jgi:predicted metal-dependent enzyme (double-stranded beta helix superfamily)
VTILLERLIDDCRSALKSDAASRNILEIVAAAVSARANLVAALGTPMVPGLHTLYQADDLTVLNIVWGPGMTIMPHDHRMWAVVGLYAGREDNIFWHRVPGSRQGRIEATHARALSQGQAVILPRDVIHSVTNPISGLTGAIHVYGGDFFAAARSEWDPETLRERPFNVERAKRLFQQSGRP